MKLSRRDVIRGATAATVSAAFWYPSGRVLGANDRVNIAVVGLRSQGGALMNGFAGLKNCQVSALCDIDENLFDRRIGELKNRHKYSAAPKTYWDMRKLYDDKDVQAVVVATPNHWHALATIWAAQAGKHVYVEKPSSQYVWEGRQMVNAARRHKVLVQVGFQNRSRSNTKTAIKFLHEGKLGKLYRVRGLCYKRRLNIGKYPDGPMQPGDKTPPMVGYDQAYTAAYLEKVHYDNWIGPAPAKPFNPNRFHYNWHWQFDYGGGDTANQGPHQFDVGRWGINRDEYPVKVRSFGGLYLYGDSQQNTPNEQTSIFEYADGLVFEFATRGLPSNAEGMHKRGEKTGGILIGNIFYGDKGRLEIDDGGHWTAFSDKDEVIADSRSIKEEASDATVTVGQGSGAHYKNFVDAIAADDPKMPKMLACDIEVGHRSSVLPALANISYRLGRELKINGKKEQFVGDAQANRMLKRNDRKGYAIPKLGGVSA
jgi:predicted dehydrogenase